MGEFLNKVGREIERIKNLVISIPLTGGFINLSQIMALDIVDITSIHAIANFLV